MSYTEYTLWLLPKEPLSTLLRTIMDRVATQLQAVSFEPHTTVFCGAGSKAAARNAANQIARRFGPITLIPEGLAHTDQYTKTLFVQFQYSAQLRDMAELAKQLYAPESRYTLNPHLSIAYKKLPENRRQELAHTVDIPINVYSFDRVRVIKTELPIEDSGPVQRWRIVHEVALSD